MHLTKNASRTSASASQDLSGAPEVLPNAQSNSNPVSCRWQVDPSDPGFVYEDWFLPKRLPFKRKHHFRDCKKYWKRLKQIVGAQNRKSEEPTYMSIEAGASTYPAKKYCDITGLEAQYTDPKTKLRYANKELFATVRAMPHDAVQARLCIRHAQVVLR